MASNMLPLKSFLEDRLSALAEEIFEFVEKRVDEYKLELCRVINLEVGNLRTQLQHLLQSDSCNGAKLQEHIQHLLPSPPPSSEDLQDTDFKHIEKDGTSSSFQHTDEITQVKKKCIRNPCELSLGHGSEPMEDMNSQAKDGASSEPNVNDLPFNFNHGQECNLKPYTCAFCKKGYDSSYQLTRHVKLHTCERSYVCPTCNKGFISTARLTRHQTLHTNDKSFVCLYCNKCYKWRDSLTKHEKKMHKMKAQDSTP
ncbi:zinc finger protein 236-like [Corythoichthys intestinalis]|uniref:zinc finger protein 236-like n=1 Tax=Corythoichthys intestinalis TaxID=161448 RepID=UPI0025A621F1|nr:zinc finger protein 236-like [Corythoichthys intestinalis]